MNKAPKRPHASSRLDWPDWLASARKGGVTLTDTECLDLWKKGQTPSEALEIQFQVNRIRNV